MASASSMPSSDARQDLKNLLECSICLETFDDPRTLHCLHSFCKKCLENFVDGKREDELNCPVCRCQFTLDKEGVTGMTRNHFICSMVEVMSIQDQRTCIPCSHCQQPSAGRCESCELFMCETCMQSHNGYLGFRDHVVLTMDELSKPENQSKIKKISKCPEHPKKKLKYYCETCDELICRHCMDFDHDKQHKFSPLEKTAKAKRKEMKQNCETLERTVAFGEQETTVLKETRGSINRNFDKAQRVINERKEHLLNRLQEKVRRKTNSMIEDARTVCETKTRKIDNEIQEKETFMSRMNASVNMARSLLENGNDEEIVRSCQSVQRNVHHQMEKRKSIAEDCVVISWSSDEIDTMLLEEIKDIIEDKDEMGETKEHDEVAMPRMSTSRKTVRTYRDCFTAYLVPKPFTAYVYEEDLRKLRELVQPYANIETGGDLFGLWQDQRTVIIQRVTGPGEKCIRTTGSFYQDVEYLHKVGTLLTTEEGLCNVGEWHSHHQMGMPEPSEGDRTTVFDNMPHLALQRFVLFIATIEKTGKRGKRSKDVKLEEIKLNPYLFINSPQDILRGEIEIIPGKNPHDMNTKTENAIKEGAEEPKNGKKPAPTSDKKSNGKTKQDPHAGQDQDKGKSRDSGSQAQRREIDKKENQSPNPNNFSPPPANPNNFFPPQNVASQGTGHSIRGYMPPTTSATAPSLGITWDNSLKFQTAQQTGQPPYTRPTQPLQPTSFSPPFGASGNAGARQERGRGSSEHYSRSTKPSHTSQTSNETYPAEQQKRMSRDQVPREKQAQAPRQVIGNMTERGFFQSIFD